MNKNLYIFKVSIYITCMPHFQRIDNFTHGKLEVFIHFLSIYDNSYISIHTMLHFLCFFFLLCLLLFM